MFFEGVDGGFSACIRDCDKSRKWTSRIEGCLSGGFSFTIERGTEANSAGANQKSRDVCDSPHPGTKKTMISFAMDVIVTSAPFFFFLRSFLGAFLPPVPGLVG